MPDLGKLLVGDCREQLAALPGQSVHCIVTSPPYFGLRSYLPADHPDKTKEIGLEGDLQAYVDNLVSVFREAHRVLRDDGTLWLNLGDSYAGSGKGQWDKHGSTSEARERYRPKHGELNGGSRDAGVGLKPKDLIGVPWRVALALQADGWYLRDAIVWAKGTSGDKRQGSVMPSSVKDRFCSAYEMVFLLSKSPKYYFDMEAVKEPLLSTQEEIDRAAASAKANHTYGEINGSAITEKSFSGRLTGGTPRNVWLIGTKPFKEAHFAAFPTTLAEMCMAAGCPERVCVTCDAPHERIITDTGIEDPTAKGSRFDIGKTGSRDGGDRTQPGTRTLKAAVGWKSPCGHNDGVSGGVVLDPFFGAGTVGLVAESLERGWVGCELNPEYAKMAMRRIEEGRPLTKKSLTASNGTMQRQRALFGPDGSG